MLDTTSVDSIRAYFRQVALDRHGVTEEDLKPNPVVKSREYVRHQGPRPRTPHEEYVQRKAREIEKYGLVGYKKRRLNQCLNWRKKNHAYAIQSERNRRKALRVKVLAHRKALELRRKKYALKNKKKRAPARKKARAR
jgi:hypothetical protein